HTRASLTLLFLLSYNCFFCHCTRPSFPTRRSSDLQKRIPVKPIASLFAMGLSLVRRIVSRRRLIPCARMGRDFHFHRFHFVSPSDRKSTRLNSSHVSISYAVFCLKIKQSNLYCCLF